MRQALLKHAAVAVCMAISIWVWSQEKEPTLTSQDEDRMEKMAEKEMDIKDDSWWQQREYYRRHPLNLNTANENALHELQVLTDIQISNFLSYRALLGKLIDIYELQAIPAWDILTINGILPFITINNEEDIIENFGQRFRKGSYTTLVRVGLTSRDSNYLGSGIALMTRYTYKYKNLLQFGITGDKDAGEQFFRGSQRVGFDFYSFHLFARNIGNIQSLAIGDFTVNMGQGLIQWGSLAFTKSAAVLDIKRQGPLLKPYNSAGEFNFYRGAGITMRSKKTEWTIFVSTRKLSANLVTDSLHATPYISSLITSGYHRTPAELVDKNTLSCLTAGGNFTLHTGKLKAGLNAVQYFFSAPFQSSGKPYDIFSMQGKSWSNYSIDYNYTIRNLHLFGEMAIDKNRNTAFLNGLLMSLNSRADLAIVYRQISKAYQSLFSNAFTENSTPVNEQGIYTGLSLSIASGWKMEAYADLFRFPWLKYRVSSPSIGSDYFVQVTWLPVRQAEIYLRFRNESKAYDRQVEDVTVNNAVMTSKQSWRTQITYSYSKQMMVRSRMEIISYRSFKEAPAENGFLWLGNIHCKQLLKSLSVAFNMIYFETDGYDTRIYAYEGNSTYGFSLPAWFNKGIKYGLNIQYRLPSILFNRFLHNTSWQLSLDAGYTASSPGTDAKLQIIMTAR